MASTLIFIWWDTYSDSFYDEGIAKLDGIEALHLVMDNPTLNFGKSKLTSGENVFFMWASLCGPLIEDGLFKPRKKDIDVAFFGQYGAYRSIRREFIEFLLEHNFSGFISLLPKGGQVSTQKYAEILGRSKIGINFSYSVDKHQLKGRVSEILHSGAMLLEQENEQTSSIFEDGVDYVSFSTKEDLVGKIKYYLDHEDERARIAESGRSKVLQKCNYHLFWDVIFNHDMIKN